MPKNHAAGEKVAGTHTSHIDAVGPVVQYLNRCPFVKKYSLGMIQKGSSRDSRIKIYPINGGVRLVVYGNAYFQELYVYTTDNVFTSSLRQRMKGRYIVQEGSG